MQDRWNSFGNGQGKERQNNEQTFSNSSLFTGDMNNTDQISGQSQNQSQAQRIHLPPPGMPRPRGFTAAPGIPMSMPMPMPMPSASDVGVSSSGRPSIVRNNFEGLLPPRTPGDGNVDLQSIWRSGATSVTELEGQMMSKAHISSSSQNAQRLNQNHVMNKSAVRSQNSPNLGSQYFLNQQQQQHMQMHHHQQQQQHPYQNRQTFYNQGTQGLPTSNSPGQGQYDSYHMSQNFNIPSASTQQQHPQQSSSSKSRFMQQPWFSANENETNQTAASSKHHYFGSSTIAADIPSEAAFTTSSLEDRSNNSYAKAETDEKSQLSGDGTAKLTDEEMKKLAAKKAARTARFYWKPVGVISVRPSITGPNQKIEVSWRIPISEVSSSSYNRREADLTDKHDWIGLFRSRKRIDAFDGHILSRELKGHSNVIFNDRDNEKYAVGQIHLRTPRGVGEYDFRYFKCSNMDSDSFRNEHAETDEEYNEVRLPLARSAPVIVEVQGAALYEAIEFVENNLDDDKRMSNATAQLATLIGQIKTLKRPLLCDLRPSSNNGRRGGGRRGGSSSHNRNHQQKRSRAAEKRMESEQERELIAFIFKIVFTCMKKVNIRCTKLLEKIENLSEKAEEKRKNFKIVEEHRKKIVEEEKELDEEDFSKWKEAKNAMVTVDRSIGGWNRECTSLSSAMRAVIDEILNSEAINIHSYPKERDALIETMHRFCPLSGMFFQTLEEMETFYTEKMKIAFRKGVPMTLRDNNPNFGVTMQGFRILPNVRLGADVSNEMQSLFHKVGTCATSVLAKLTPPSDYAAKRFQFLNKVELAINSSVKWSCGAKLVPFGSSANNFGSKSSDLDICLVLLPKEYVHSKRWQQALVNDIKADDPPSAVQAVEDLVEVLNSINMDEVDDQRKTARIPIVKFNNPENGLECDMCIDNRLAIRNTMLLRTYSLIDNRVREIAYIVKAWAKKRGINNPAMHTLPSYGYLLLVIKYLQLVTPHPVVPVLQELDSSWNGINNMNHIHGMGQSQMQTPHPVIVSGNDGKKHDTYFYGDPTFSNYESSLAKLQAFARRNTSTTAELLVGFFEFYAFQLDYRRFVVSIRSSEWITKEQKAAEDSWKLHLRIAIEDPFETSYDVAHMLRDSGFNQIRREFARAYAILTNQSLDSRVHSSNNLVDALFLEPLEEEQDLEEMT